MKGGSSNPDQMTRAIAPDAVEFDFWEEGREKLKKALVLKTTRDQLRCRKIACDLGNYCLWNRATLNKGFILRCLLAINRSRLSVGQDDNPPPSPTPSLDWLSEKSVPQENANDNIQSSEWWYTDWDVNKYLTLSVTLQKESVYPVLCFGSTNKHALVTRFPQFVVFWFHFLSVCVLLKFVCQKQNCVEILFKFVFWKDVSFRGGVKVKFGTQRPLQANITVDQFEDKQEFCGETVKSMSFQFAMVCFYFSFPTSITIQHLDGGILVYMGVTQHMHNMTLMQSVALLKLRI